MPRYYFDLKVGDRTYQDRFGDEYPDSIAAREGLRETILELARQQQPILNTDYEITLREELKPVYKMQLTVAGEVIG